MERVKPKAAAAPDALAGRVRAALAAEKVTETRMFGGIAFMLDGKMVASASRRGLLLRVGKEGQDAALKAGAELAVMGQRTMSGYVRIAEEGLTDAALHRWLDGATAFVRSLPDEDKPKRPTRRP